MLTEAFFSPADSEKLQKGFDKIKRVGKVVVIFSVVMDVGIAYLVTRDNPKLLLPVMAALLLLSGVLLWISLFRLIKLYRRDLADQMKLKGQVTVKSKSVHKGTHTLALDSDEVKTIVVEKSVYDNTREGDTVSIEVSKHGKALLNFEKHQDQAIPQ